MNMRWINGKKTELLPPIDNDDFPKQYTCRVYGDDPHSGCVAVFNATAEEMRKVNEDGYWEWLDESESSSPSHNDIVQEMESDLSFLEEAIKEEEPGAISLSMSKQISIIKKYLPKLKQIGEGSAEKELAEIKAMYEKEPYAFLFSNALRLLSNEQMKSMADSLYERIPKEMRPNEGSESYWKKEVERLKGLIESLYKGENYMKMSAEDRKAYWERFQKINNLESSIGEETEGGWISVEDRLPEAYGKDNSENVFAICDGRLMVMAYCYIHADEHSGWAWCSCNGDIHGDPEFDDEYKVTHWQPLPKPPINTLIKKK